jgi:hypothetical protein
MEKKREVPVEIRNAIKAVVALETRIYFKRFEDAFDELEEGLLQTIKDLRKSYKEFFAQELLDTIEEEPDKLVQNLIQIWEYESDKEIWSGLSEKDIKHLIDVWTREAVIEEE